MAHTPGPWQVYWESLHGIASYGLANTQGAETNEEAAANTHLIAAAPELLAVLKSLYGRVPHTYTTTMCTTCTIACDRCAMDAVIAKAEGKDQPEPNCDCGRYHPVADSFEIGDRVRIRVHRRLRHATGTITAKRDGFNGQKLYNISLDANPGRFTALMAFSASELWKYN